MQNINTIKLALWSSVIKLSFIIRKFLKKNRIIMVLASAWFAPTCLCKCKKSMLVRIESFMTLCLLLWLLLLFWFCRTYRIFMWYQCRFCKWELFFHCNLLMIFTSICLCGQEECKIRLLIGKEESPCRPDNEYCIGKIVHCIYLWGYVVPLDRSVHYWKTIHNLLYFSFDIVIW